MNSRDLEVVEDPADPVVFGVDVARQGGDSSIILVRQGPIVHEITEYKKLDTMELADLVACKAADWEPAAIYVDGAGIGIGVYDRLKHSGVPGVYPLNVANAARKAKFVRLRDELWWDLRDRFEQNLISLHKCPDHQLIAELSAIKFAINDKGKIKVESKLEMRKRNMPSPNRADALMLTMMSNEKALAAPRKLAKRDYGEDDDPSFRRRVRGGGRAIGWNSRKWMGC
jgi:hypothetical protein